MNGAAVVMIVLAFLPALLPLSQGRIGATIGVGLLCVCASFALVLFVVPGVLLWFVALFIGMWSANGAKQDRQHRALMQTMSARQASADPAFDARCRSHIRRYKPAFSNRLVYEADINGERRKFWNDWEAMDYVARRVGSPQNTPQLPAPERATGSYKGISYVLCSDYSVTVHTAAGTEVFPSMFAFRAWVDSTPNAS